VAKFSKAYLFLKRIIDIVMSIVALILLLPILLITAASIFLFDRHYIVFIQNRVGLAGKLFRLYKFRSMVVNAEKLGGHSTSDNDSRITPVGKFIRRSSIDELPQLVNVLKGEMSIVGPRPDVLKQKSEYSDEEWLKRLSVKPGITGLAQATLRSTATPEQRKRLDLEYVEHQSMWLDIKIILLTFKQVIFRGGN